MTPANTSSHNHLAKLAKWAAGALFAALVAYLIFVVLLVAAPYLEDYFGGIPFDANRWREWKQGQNEEEWRLRWEMTSSLLSKHKITGMPRDEVIELLGAPDGEEEGKMYYYLGMSGHGIDTGSLILYLDSQRRVHRYERWHG